MKTHLLLAMFVLAILSVNAQNSWKDESLSFEVRTAELVKILSLEEKTQLMRYDSPAIERLGIKSYNWWNECLHGVARTGQATVFPQAIGMAAMWDQWQMAAIATTISDEARAKYNDYQRQGKYNIYQGLTYWTPNINIFRDPRWGRGMETYGEDPFLTAEMAIPFIKGLQGNDAKYLKLVSTVKHFAVHSGPEGLRHSFDVWPSDYDLAETYFPHFERTVKESGAYSVMCAYQRFKGAPCCGSSFLENKLRNEWGFDGYIVSDCWAIRDFYEKNAHDLVATPEEAAAMAVKAGTDLNCGSVYASSLLKSVKMGLLAESEIDRSVHRLILARMKLGEFDNPDKVQYSKLPLSIVDSKEHNQIALDASRKSMVLLQNNALLEDKPKIDSSTDNSKVLPFSKNVTSVAVIGPNADNPEILLANYNGYSKQLVTPYQGIKSLLPTAKVNFALGCRLADELPYLTPVASDHLFVDLSKSNHGLNARYFQTKDCKGEPMLKRVDETVDFRWWNGSPSAEINADSYSASWEGILVPPVSGKYALGGEANNGFNLYVDGSLFLQANKSEHHPRIAYEYIELEAGKSYRIRFDLLENAPEYALARLLWDIPKPDLIHEAVALAKKSDVVVLCVGLSPSLEGEEMKVKVPGFDMGDRVDIELPASQRKLIAAIQALNKPTALVLMNGSAVSLSGEAMKIPAILEAWYPGQAGGTAIADVLFGDYNPAGRLPLTFYKSMDQIPAFHEYDMKGKTYKYFEGKAQFEFGYGLSYASFAYNNLNITKAINSSSNSTANNGSKRTGIKLSVEVTNSGKLDGEEVVQVYVSHPHSDEKKPIRSLEGFQRIHLKRGETKTVEFTLKPDQLTVRNQNNEAVMDELPLLISVGGKQPDLVSIKNRQVVEAEISIN